MRVSVISFLILCYSSVFAQFDNYTLSGITIDGISHHTIRNVTIVVNGGSDTLFSDQNGEFFIDNKNNNTLNLSFQAEGYYSLEETIRFGNLCCEQRIIHLNPRFIQTAPVIISGFSSGSNLSDYYRVTSILSGKELNKELGNTLATSLKNEPGLAVRSMGPAPARPVIRGLGGERIIISQDGQKAVDLSSTSPDHAVTLDPFTVEKIEIMRGPIVLTKSQASFGGVINSIKNDIPATIPRHLFMTAGIFYESANQGRLGSFGIKVPYHSLVLNAEYSGRLADELKTPVGIIKNTQIRNNTFSVGASYFSDKSYMGGNIREFSSEYGVPGGFIGAHPNGIDIELFRRENNLKYFTPLTHPFFTDLTINLNRNYFRQTEYENAGMIGSEFSINNFRGSLEINAKRENSAYKGIFGLSAERNDFRIGGFVFTAPTISDEYSAYYYGSYAIESLNLEYAVRFTHKSYSPSRANLSSREEFLKKRIFNAISGSVTFLYNYIPGINVGINFSSSSRIPSVEELYTEGPHLAAYSYEIGNPDLRVEKNFGKEIFSYIKDGNNFFTFTIFHNDFTYYITPRNTGKINYARLLPVYQVIGSPAELFGFEAKGEYNFTQNIALISTVSYTRGRFKESKSSLPSIPPLRGVSGVRFNFSNHLIGMECEAVTEQNYVDEFETTTPGYFIAGIYYQVAFQVMGYVNLLSVNVENIFNKEYRNHLSRLKVILPEAGRNVKLIYKLYL